MQSETITPDRAAPLRVAELKTAAYSVVLPLRLGAVAAGCTSEATLRSLTQVGIALGIAYQLADDDLGLFGATESTGKSVLSDVRQGKRTEHIRIAYARAGFADRATLDAVLGLPDATDADADLVRDIVLRTGARESVDPHDRRTHEPGHPTRRHGAARPAGNLPRRPRSLDARTTAMNDEPQQQEERRDHARHRTNRGPDPGRPPSRRPRRHLARRRARLDRHDRRRRPARDRERAGRADRLHDGGRRVRRRAAAALRRPRARRPRHQHVPRSPCARSSSPTRA